MIFLVIVGVGHAGDGGWGYNTHPGASLCIIPIPFEGTDPRNWIGRRTVMPMCSGASWQKFGATKTEEETLAAKSVGSRPAEAGFGQHDDHRHRSGQLVPGRFDPAWHSRNGKRKADCLQPSSREDVLLRKQKGGRQFF